MTLLAFIIFTISKITIFKKMTKSTRRTVKMLKGLFTNSAGLDHSLCVIAISKEHRIHAMGTVQLHKRMLALKAIHLKSIFIILVGRSIN